MPPRRPIVTAKAGSTTPSIAAARMGMSNVEPSRSKETSISSGLMVTVPGTSATSSNP